LRSKMSFSRSCNIQTLEHKKSLINQLLIKIQQ